MVGGGGEQRTETRRETRTRREKRAWLMVSPGD